MTSRLAHLRANLASLRRARLGVRRMTAWSAAATSVLVALAGVFVLDLAFELAVSQRLVVLGLAVIAVVWALRKLTWPFLGQREDEVELALLVERQQTIDSDLVAALQFDATEIAPGASAQLATAVVERVAAFSPGVDVFAGLARDQMLRRLALLSACVTIVVIAVALSPGHLAAFAERLLLGSRHYPTRTRLEQVVVNRTQTLDRRQHGAQPEDCRAAEGQPLSFWIECSGRLPEVGAVQLSAVAKSRGRTRVELKAISLADRLTRLQLARSKLSDAAANPTVEMSPLVRDELVGLVRFDAPEAAKILVTTKTSTDFAAAARALVQAIDQWPGPRQRRAILTGELGRLNDDVTYKLSVGDAWTDPAIVRVIPLPIVELRLTPSPPKYAAGRPSDVDPTARQLAVLEGSSIQLDLECVNGKPLQSAWLTLQSANGMARVDLVPRDAERLTWTLPETSDALANIRQELRYSLEAVDADGLSQESPIRGTIRIRPDQPPTSITAIVHKVILPTAEPVVSYRASDDFGLSRLALVVEVERAATAKSTGTQLQHGSISPQDAAQPGVSAGDSDLVAAPATAADIERHQFDIIPPNGAVTSDRLPLAGQYRLALSPLKLAKGDRLKLALEATDSRGENEAGQSTGVAATSEPLAVEIADEAGVLAAISQADERSEQQLTDIIKRQLGIGEER